MSHKYEHVSTGAGFAVSNSSAGVVTKTVVINQDGTIGTSGASQRVVGTLYANESGKSVGTLKMHNHLTTSGYNAELKGESVKTSGTYYGLDNEAHLAATGTASVMGTRGIAVVDATFTITGGTIIGTYGQARADGTVAGSSFLAGLYGLIEASAAITASHVCSAWLDSHQANAVTGSHQLLYMTNNGAAQMDEVMYIYGGDKITALMALDTVSGMVAATAETGGSSKKIKITIDGTVHYLNAYTG